MLTLVLLDVDVDLATALLSYFTLSMVIAAVGGVWPSVVTAVAGFAGG